MSNIMSYLTDLEGNLGYFERWARRSNHLQLESGVLAFRDVKPHHNFVYGGDFCDKGPGDLRIGAALIDFKKKYPSDVFLIAGNREIKCRRFTYELSTDIQQRLLVGPAAFWNQNASPRLYAMQQLQAETKKPITDVDVERYILNKSNKECQTLYLKWMLNETMGCGPFQNKPSTFEYRRMELAQMSGLPNQGVSDETVTQSFIDSLAPGGVVNQYLKLAQLGVVIGETLFVHGAVTLENMGYIPGMKESQPRITDAKEWIDALNDWYREQINEWSNNPIENKLHAPGHKPLDKYVLFNPKSVVTNNWYIQGKLAPIPDKVVKFLNEAGIYRVISGHQPFSDFPLIIRHENLEVIVGDTGYSDSTAAKDNRGEALHNLDVIGLGKHSHASIDAIFKDGSSMLLTLPSRAKGNGTDIGHFTRDGQLIRPMNSTQLCSSQLDGFKIIDAPVKEHGPFVLK